MDAFRCFSFAGTPQPPIRYTEERVYNIHLMCSSFVWTLTSFHYTVITDFVVRPGRGLTLFLDDWVTVRKISVCIHESRWGIRVFFKGTVTTPTVALGHRYLLSTAHLEFQHNGQFALWRFSDKLARRVFPLFCSITLHPQ